MSIKLTAVLPLTTLLLLGGLLNIGSCVSVTPRLITIDVGETVELTAHGNDDTTFSWASSNTAVASVDQNGFVTGISAGSTVITATGDQSGFIGRSRVIVRESEPSAVTVLPSTGEVDVGGTFDFNASSTDASDTSFSWESDDETVATVDANGTVTGVAEGTAIITATGSSSGDVGTATITVNAVTGVVTVDAPSTSVQIGETLQVYAESTDPLDTSFTWDSDNDAVATVDTNGLVTGVAAGQANISATGSNSGESDSVTITVTTGVNTLPTANAGPDATVPYNTLVTLAGSGTDPDVGDTLTFLWAQVSGPAVTLSSTTAQNPTFTPPEPGSYVFSLVVNDGTGDSEVDQVTITAENTPPTIDIVIEGISETDAADRGITTGESSGLNTVGVNSAVYLRAVVSDPNGDDITGYLWDMLTSPGGSNPQFSETNVPFVVLVTDTVGTYEVVLDVQDELGLSSTVSQTIHAATYVGSGVVNLGTPNTLTQSTCTACHNGSVAPDNFTPWLLTPHAVAFATYVDGSMTNPPISCVDDTVLKFITTGYNVYADNGGFDDLALTAGFTLPVPEPGTYATLVADEPALMKLANVQCESCHGPASLHPANAFASDKRISVSLAADACGQCHQEERQWEHSGHSDATSQAFTYPIGPTRTDCVQCHSGEAYIDFADGETTLRTGFQTHTCAVCHDPHNSTDNEAQLRIVDAVTLPGDLTVTGQESSATCMVCHNGRRGPADAVNSGFPHYSTATENLLGVNAVDYNGKYTFPNSPHAQLAHPTTGDTNCVMCHMAPTPEDECTDNLVGGHTFALAAIDESQTKQTEVTNVVNACQACHGPSITELTLPADGDYDGDGTAETIRDEVDGLLTVLLTALEANGVTHLSHFPYWQNVTMDAQRFAIFNHELVSHDGSGGAHNARFSISVLQATYREFTGQDVPGVEPADLLYSLTR